MIFEQIEVKGLSHYSYLLGCEKTKLAVVVDPRRDIDIYLELANKHGLKIRYVTETHIHADYASGALELAKKTGATLAVSAHDKGELYQTKFEHQQIKDGEALVLGGIELKALHTPGHTPEHLSFLASENGAPRFMLSGDFIFVGSLGRPDLLGEDAKLSLAKSLFKSVKKMEPFSNDLIIYPAHGAGSMCGAGLGKASFTTLGAERISNPYFDKSLSESGFVEKILSNLPPLPSYYPKMKRLNSEGPKILDGLPGLTALSLEKYKGLINDGAQIIDVRDQASFADSHIPNSYGLGPAASISTWASWLLDYEKPILLLNSGEQKSIEDAVRCLVRVGLDGVAGYLAGGFKTWQAENAAARTIVQFSASDLAAEIRNLKPKHIIDVRNPNEYQAGHITEALNIPLHELQNRLSEVPNDGEKLVVHCAGGYRAIVALSVLERAGFRNLINLSGGVSALGAAIKLVQ